MGKVHMHVTGSGCMQIFFLPRAALLIFYKMYQSINQSTRYLSMVVIKAEKLMGPSQKKKEEIQNYYNNYYYQCTVTTFLHTKILQVIKNKYLHHKL